METKMKTPEIAPDFTLVNYWPSPAERRRNARRIRRYKLERAALRWFIRTFRIYRHASL